MIKIDVSGRNTAERDLRERTWTTLSVCHTSWARHRPETSHRSQEADLVYEAVDVDLGAGD